MAHMQHKRTVSRTFPALVLVSACYYLGLAGAGSAAPQQVPVNTAPPTITGTARVGQTMTAQNGTWENSPTAFEYRWLRCGPAGARCVAIPGATEMNYTLVTADAGHTMRVRVTAVNADGATSARSAPTAVVSPSPAPRNTERPTISGLARVGEELTANEGSWTGTPVSFAYQWERCDVDAVNCFDVTGATGKTYGVRLADLGFRLRVEVTARNDAGIGRAVSGLTAIVAPVARITNRRPTLRILSVRFFGPRIYARFRICDDSFKNLTIIQTDSRPGRLSYTRRFATLVPPRPCGVYTRSWIPAPRFTLTLRRRGPGRYTLTLRARDKSRLTSIPARRSFVR
jgi:hypothetical protein